MAAFDYTIYNNIEDIEKVGEGGFGPFGAVQHVSFKKPYKGYKEAAVKTFFELEDKEVEIMSQLHHPNIVELLGFCHIGSVADMILMEYASNGSLHDYLSDRLKPLPYELKKKWAQESALGIQHLHSHNVLHRYIKPQNCLLFQDNLLKLSDFGIDREIERSCTRSFRPAKETYRYMAPEIQRGFEQGQGRANHSKPADIYSYGMLVLEICARKPPFDGMQWQTVVLQVGNGTKPTIPGDCPQDLSDLIQHCWNTDPKGRPTIGSIVDGELGDKRALCKWLRREFHPKYQGESLRADFIACCPNGDMVVAAAVNGETQLCILGSDGQYKMWLTSSETNPDKQMRFVDGITVSPQGYILVVDGTKYVKVFDVKGKYLHCFSVFTANEDPNTDCEIQCIAMDGEGKVLVGDYMRKIITIHTCPDGQLVNQIKCDIGCQASMVVNSKSQILLQYRPDVAAVYSKVVAIDYSGNEVFTFTPSIDEDVTGKEVWAHGIVCDADDNIYIAIAKYAAANRCYMAYLIHNTGHIHKYSPTGAFLKCIAKGLRDSCDLSITSDGSLVVANGKSVLFYS